MAISQQFGEQLDVHEGGRYASISKLLSDRLGIKLTEIRQVISASLAEPKLARDLGIARNRRS